MKAIVLSGGEGTRLYPLTKAISKQLNPVYDKPMIYYSLSVLMLAGIREILIISREKDQALFQSLLGDGSAYGVKIFYAIQEEARGIGEAFLIGEKFLEGESCAFILGDNFFYGHGFTGMLEEAKLIQDGAIVFPYYFPKPKDFGVVQLNSNNKILSLEEKPEDPKSNLIIPGLYFFDSTVVEKAKKIKPSIRGELEIIPILQQYLEEEKLHAILLGRGMAWFDMGTEDALLEAANFVKTIQSRQGISIACLEEIAYRKDWLTKETLQGLVNRYPRSNYTYYLKRLLEEESCQSLEK